jgi:hypothetical protein
MTHLRVTRIRHKEESQLATAEGIVRFPLTLNGVREARQELDGVERGLSGGATTNATPAPVSTPHPSRGKVLFDHLDDRSRGRELLAVLPEGKDNGLTPEELSRLMSPGPDGEPLKKSSVRAVIRNAWRGAEYLKGAGRLDSRVVQRHFDRYEVDRAGRYYLEPGDAVGIPGR